MVTFEALKEIEAQKKLYDNFFIPTIIFDKELNIFWGNQILKNHISLSRLSSKDFESLLAAKLKNYDQILLANKNLSLKSFYKNDDSVYHADFILLKTNNDHAGCIVLFSQDNATFGSINNDILLNISHNISNSLNIIIRSKDMIQQKLDFYSADWIRGYIDQMDISLYKILRTSTNMNTFLDLSSHNFHLNLELVDITDWAQGVKLIVDEFLKDTDINFELILENKLILTQVDLNLFEIAFFNLLHNAIYYSQGNNKIVATFSAKSDQLLFSLSDSGTGFPIEHLDNSNENSSSQLSLKLVKKIANVLESTFIIDSVLHSGTIAKMELPLNLANQTSSFASKDFTYSFHDKYSNIYIGLTSALELPYYKKNDD